MQPLTRRQQQVLRYIEKFWRKAGYSPSVRDISEQFEVNVNAIAGHLNSLERKGAIRRSERVARSIVVL